jgi:hypothetical protein
MGIGDKVGVAFAGAFYRALGFGKSVRDAFDSARAELALTKIPRSRGIELFVRNGISEKDKFPQSHFGRNTSRYAINTNYVLRALARFETQITVHKTFRQTVFV